METQNPAEQPEQGKQPEQVTNTPAPQDTGAPTGETQPSTTTSATISSPVVQPMVSPEVQQIRILRDKVIQSCQQVVLGYTREMELILAALLAEGHVLLEGVPGIAKTLLAKAMAKSIGTEFNRIQFTPDLMPADVIGTNVFNPKNHEFEFKSGPIFSNLVLVDEINRSPAKTQAALFEVMEEKQITVDGQTYPLSFPFMILATQNPIEQEGTYRLPEAQLDRFVFRLKMNYPDQDSEINILKRFRDQTSQNEIDKVQPVVNVNELKKAVGWVHTIRISDDLLHYIGKIVSSTRDHIDLFLGASPRASLAILRTSKVIAAFNGRDYVVPDDIKTVAKSVLNHRVIVSAENEMRGVTAEEIIDQIIEQIEVPR